MASMKIAQEKNSLSLVRETKSSHHSNKPNTLEGFLE